TTSRLAGYFLVVPANAGTHTPRTLILRSEVDALLHNECQGLWVPAFAGTTKHRFAFSRQCLSEVCRFVRSLFKQRAHATLERGRREDRVRAAPAVSCAMGNKECAHEQTGSAETLRPSLRNGLTAYAVLSLVTGFLTPSPAGLTANLTPALGASGPHGFAVRTASLVL